MLCTVSCGIYIYTAVLCLWICHSTPCYCFISWSFTAIRYGLEGRKIPTTEQNNNKLAHLSDALTSFPVFHGLVLFLSNLQALWQMDESLTLPVTVKSHLSSRLVNRKWSVAGRKVLCRCVMVFYSLRKIIGNTFWFKEV